MTGPAAVTVLSAAAPARIDAAALLLRDLVGTARDRSGDPQAARVRTWAILGELVTDAGLTDDARVLEHDRLGRLAVRLGVDKVLCVGDQRTVRGLHQGAVMEGSWGDESRLVADIAAAESLLRADTGWQPTDGDVVLVAGPEELSRLTGRWARPASERPDDIEGTDQ